jgi:hypothetical protein
MTQTFFSLDFHMNNETAIDNNEYVFVEFDDNEMDIDEDSYDQCDELSLTPSTSASVCSETMFGDLGFIPNSAPPSTNAISKPVESGKPRSCSVVSLHDEEEEQQVQVQKEKDVDVTTSQNATLMDIDTDMGTPMTTITKDEVVVKEEINKTKSNNKQKARTLNNDKKGTKNYRLEDETPTVSTSRLSNKKRRKKMKQLKKAAALAAFTAMKEKSIETVTTSTIPPSVAARQSKKIPKNSPMITSKKIAVICARDTLTNYKDDLREELEMKKKMNGTLNFSVC